MFLIITMVRTGARATIRACHFNKMIVHRSVGCVNEPVVNLSTESFNRYLLCSPGVRS